MDIETKIINRIERWKEGDFSLSCRDSVQVKTINGKIKAVYILWVSPIFDVTKEIDGSFTVKFSFCGYSTQTTKNRLSTLINHFSGGYIFQKNYKMYYRNMNREVYPIDTEKSYMLKDGKLFETSGKEATPIKDLKF